MPHTIEDLQNFNIISFGQNVPYLYISINWHLKNLPTNYEPKIQVNSGVTILKLVQSGCDIGSVSQKGYAISNPKLVWILPNEIIGPTINITYNYPKTREGEPLIKQLYELLKNCL